MLLYCACVTAGTTKSRELSGHFPFAAKKQIDVPVRLTQTLRHFGTSSGQAAGETSGSQVERST